VDILGTVKSAYDLVRTIQADVKDARLQSAISELLTKLNDVLFQLGDLRSTTLKLERENEQLRLENNQMKQWNQDKEQYVLKQLGPGTFVYAAKEAEQTPSEAKDSSCYLCPHCYDRREKVILQFSSFGFDGTHYVCHSCKLEVIDRNQKAKAEAFTVPRKTRWDGY